MNWYHQVCSNLTTSFLLAGYQIAFFSGVTCPLNVEYESPRIETLFCACMFPIQHRMPNESRMKYFFMIKMFFVLFMQKYVLCLNWPRIDKTIYWGKYSLCQIGIFLLLCSLCKLLNFGCLVWSNWVVLLPISIKRRIFASQFVIIHN